MDYSLNNEKEKLVLEDERPSETLVLDYINTKLLPTLKKKLGQYWKCF